MVTNWLIVHVNNPLLFILAYTLNMEYVAFFLLYGLIPSSPREALFSPLATLPLKVIYTLDLEEKLTPLKLKFYSDSL